MALMSALVAPGKPDTRAIAERHLEELFEPLDFFQVCHCSIGTGFAIYLDHDSFRASVACVVPQICPYVCCVLTIHTAICLCISV